MDVTLNQDKNVIELVKQLEDNLFNEALLSAAMYAKKGSRLVSTKVSDFQEFIEEKARDYGKKITYDESTSKIQNTMEANLVREYTLALEKLVKQYDVKYKSILAQKLKLQGMDLGAMLVQNSTAIKRDEYKKAPEYAKEQSLREDAKKAIEEGDYEALETMNKELQAISKINHATKLEKDAKNIRAERATIDEEIKKYDEILKSCETERRQAVELIAGKKENLMQTSDKKYLLVIEEQNWFQKTWSKLMNKLNGGKKYIENVINPLSKKVRDINYKSTPALKSKLQSETKKVLETTEEKIVKLEYVNIIKNNNIIDKSKEKNEEKQQGIKENTKQSYRGLVSTSRGETKWLLTKTEEQIYKMANKPKRTQEQKENKGEKDNER